MCFNAHRIFNPYTIVEELNELELVSGAFIHDSKIIKSNLDKNVPNLGKYDCGLFVFKSEREN